MSEGMHSTSRPAGNRSRKRLVVIVASAALAVAAIGVSIQFFKAQPSAAVEEGTATTGRAGSGAAPNTYARVGSINITREMVAAECMERYEKEVLEKMINRALIDQACRDRGVSVSEQEVAQEITEISKKFNLDAAAWLNMLKAERGITPQQYSRDIIWPMLALKKMAGPEVTISDKDIQEAFLRNYGPRVECKLIMCDNLRRANELWTKAQENPEDFGRLARESSIEPTSRALDGDVPPIRMYGGNSAIEEKAFKLKKGEISAIIEVGTPEQKRYVILLCKGRTAQVVKSMTEDIHAELNKQLKEEKMQEAVAKVFDDIRGKIRVDNYRNNSVAGPSAETGIQKTSASNAQPRPPVNPVRVGSGQKQPPR